MYSAISGLGTHCEQVSTKEDSLTLLKITEDIGLSDNNIVLSRRWY
ncbi:hypothetical protein KQI38_20340 [Tissierella carlieri]|nr:hypothetical protein [Tissierella carlieri]MBU5314378.1 hypothetical protein [Tissierella carlieri]